MMGRDVTEPAPAARDFTSPLFLLAAAFFLMVAFQTYELVRDRITLSNVHAQQDAPVQQSLRVRQQFNAIAAGVSRLADSGDKNAQTIIDDLRRQGIAVRPNAAAAPQRR
jgi:hypothetical protein